MALIKINLEALPLEKAIGYDIVSQNGTLLLPKGRLLTKNLVEKLENVDLYVQGVDSISDGEIEGVALVTNKIASLDIGKEVESFYLIMRDSKNHKLVSCQFIGVIKDLSLVVEMPREGNGESARVIQMDPGQKIQAKLHAGRHEYVFQSFVMCVTNNPTPLMYIKYPATVKIIILRKANRKHTDLPAVLTMTDDGNRTTNITLVDLSDSGSAFVSDLMLEESKKYSISLIFKINGAEQTIELPCLIKNKKAVGRSWRYGVAFSSNLTNRDKIFLQSFIYTL